MCSPNMSLVSLFNHDTISVNRLLRLNILLALCYLACEVPATSHEDLLTSLGTSLRGRRSAEASRPPTPSLAAPLPLKRPTVSPEDQGCWGNLAVVSHQATIPTRTRTLQDELTQAGTVLAAKYTPRYTHSMRQSIRRFTLTSLRHSSSLLTFSPPIYVRQ